MGFASVNIEFSEIILMSKFAAEDNLLGGMYNK